MPSSTTSAPTWRRPLSRLLMLIIPSRPRQRRLQASTSTNPASLSPAILRVAGNLAPGLIPAILAAAAQSRIPGESQRGESVTRKGSSSPSPVSANLAVFSNSVRMNRGTISSHMVQAVLGQGKWQLDTDTAKGNAAH
jgi:hypothetical protein